MPQPVLLLRDVTIFQDNNAVLSDITLAVNHGEFLYIIGKTGSGKSSFMNKVTRAEVSR